jgi:two-component system cell cycle response regulator
LITAILGVLSIWGARQLGFLKIFLQKEVSISWYFLIILFLLLIICTSFITFWIQNVKYQKLKKDSLRDELTGLFNYKAFPQKLKEGIAFGRKEKKAVSLILIDIDNFKQINDTWLLSGGDNVMIQLGAYLGDDARASDTLCRQHMKGDEFVIIALNTNKDQARMAAERKRKEISEKEFQVGKSQLVKITVSCGIAEWEPDTDTPESLLEKANKALLLAKSLGKNKSITYQE